MIKDKTVKYRNVNEMITKRSQIKEKKTAGFYNIKPTKRYKIWSYLHKGNYNLRVEEQKENYCLYRHTSILLDKGKDIFYLLATS